MLASKELLANSANRLCIHLQKKATEAYKNGSFFKFVSYNERAYGVYIMWRLINARTQEEFNAFLNGELDE